MSSYPLYELKITSTAASDIVDYICADRLHVALDNIKNHLHSMHKHDHNGRGQPLADFEIGIVRIIYEDICEYIHYIHDSKPID